MSRPMQPKDSYSPHKIGMRGQSGGPLVTITFTYEDGTEYHADPSWYKNLLKEIGVKKP